MKVYKEYVDMNNCDLKLKSFISSTLIGNDDYITVHPHWHDEIELLYVLRGSAFQQVNEHTFNIAKGDVVVIRGQDIHATYTLEPENTEILVVMFDTSIINSQTDMIQTIFNEFNTCTTFPYPINADDNTGMEIAELIKSIHYEFVGDNAARELFIVSYCASLLGLCMRTYLTKSNNAKHPLNVKKALEKIFTLIDDNYERSISLKEAAEVSNFSIPHFCRLFRQTVGMSFIDYLNHYRINKSIQILKNGTTITETAQLCGFGCINSYIRTFKKYNTLPPSKYIENLQGVALSPVQASSYTK